MKKTKNLKKEKGITLIALVVTIVVLLILAGISLNLVLGNNGLIAKAKESKTKTEQDAVNTETAMNSLYDEMIGALGDNSNTSTGYEIVEPENIDDWEYRIEDDGTATLTMYKGNKTEVIVPNYIDGIPVKAIGTNLKGDSGYYSLWSPNICEEVSIDGYISNLKQNTITKIIVSKGIEKIDANAFYYSSALQKVIIPITLKVIRENAFANCNVLGVVYYNGTSNQWNNISIVSGNSYLTYAIKVCSDTEVIEPENIDDWEYRIEDDGTATLTMYKGNKTEVIVPNYIDGIPVKAIGTNPKGDSGYYSLWSPNICEEVSIDGYILNSKQNTITKIIVSKGITVIEGEAFYYTSNLSSITIPSSMASIESYAFDECSSLITVNYTGTEEQWNSITIKSGGNSNLTNATISYNYTGE